jgi:hypothetical protein
MASDTSREYDRDDASVLCFEGWYDSRGLIQTRQGRNSPENIEQWFDSVSAKLSIPLNYTLSSNSDY